MDQFMVDVTDIPQAKELDEVILVGRQGDEEITVDELGDLCGRFSYEFICDIGKRVPRIYTRNHEVYLVRDCSGTNCSCLKANCIHQKNVEILSLKPEAECEVCVDSTRGYFLCGLKTGHRRGTGRCTSCSDHLE